MWDGINLAKFAQFVFVNGICIIFAEIILAIHENKIIFENAVLRICSGFEK